MIATRSLLLHSLLLLLIPFAANGDVVPCGFAADTLGLRMRDILEDVMEHMLRNDLRRVACRANDQGALIHYRRNSGSVIYSIDYVGDDDWDDSLFDASHTPFGSTTTHGTGIETQEEFEACLDMMQTLALF